MKSLSVQEVRAALGQLDQLLAAEGELLITRHGKPIARVVPPEPKRQMPSHAALRNSMPRLTVPSQVYIRKDRDGE